MSAFLIDTLVWTGVLLALVLLVRRPVAQLWGARAAYALWALPMARLLLPPLVLPAWMAPAQEVAGEAVPVAALTADAAMIAVEPLDIPAAAAIPSGIDWTSALLAVWLAGAAVFLVRRYALYFRMRRELLEAARPMGEEGRVRLVETPAADGPVAFGVLDKVVALPLGFMAGHDRTARDLALAHELAHHRGRDLLCNMLVQPLFALHWFNPLSLLGWRALRRDQEAACDARVVARQPRESRAAYAAVIARFAVQPRDRTRLALAAPMACPVLGDRSIVQRLKSLAMSDISARRRWSGRLLIAASALTLPLTASISYAQDEPPVPPAPPAPVAPPAPPAAVIAPVAPVAPEPPRVIVDSDGKHRIVRIERTVTRDADRKGDRENRRVERRIIRHGDHAMSAQERAEFEQEMAELHKELGEGSEFQREMRELREQFGENGELRREMRIALAEAGVDVHEVVLAAPQVTVRCRDGQREVAETVTSKDGRERIYVCNAIALAESKKAIAVARAEIARSRELTAKQRAEALRSLDEAERDTRAN